MKASVMVGLFLILLIVPVVLAANEFGRVTQGSKLLITDVDVKVGSKTHKNLDFGDKIKEEAKPGDNVQFKIQALNNFTDAEDLEIEDMQVTVTIEGIDDDDDLEEEGEIKDLKAEKDDDVTIDFTIPLEVDEGDYDVLIEVEGEDENGTTHAVEYELELEVQKEDNEVKFLRNTVTPSEIKCGRTVQLSTSVINTGADDEDDVTLEVTNAELGVSFKETFDLSNEPFDEDSKFSKTFTTIIPQDVAPGIYTLQSVVTFNGGSDTETDAADLVVAQCEVLAEEEPAEEEEEEEDTGVVVVQPPVTDQTGMVTAGTVSAPTLPATGEKSLFESNGFLVALVAGEVLLVVIAILLVTAVMRKRSQ
ncbi:hypothetical protein HYW19_02200 [Candidatus Woesearchaeota archaeon]|nr:hypothetical protein [Candidatus Woesearchaeota archaeon]